MLVSLLALLPLLELSLTAAVPLHQAHSGVEIEPRQRGGNRGGNRGRPTGSRTRPQIQATSPAAAGTNAGSAASAPAAGSSQNLPPAAPVASSANAGTGEPILVPSSRKVCAETLGIGEGSAAAGSTGGAGTMTDTPAESDTPEPTGTANIGGSNTGGTAGSGGGPAGTGWDTVYNSADLTTYKAAGLQWWYNWQLQPTVESIVEFVPMIKFGTDVAGLTSAMGQWPAGTQYVFSFNERKSAQYTRFF